MRIEQIILGGLHTNCWVAVSDNGRCAVVDPGYDGDVVAAKLLEWQLTPAYILITHGHHDHIGGIRALREKYPGLPVYIGAEDADMLCDTSLNLAREWDGPGENYSTIQADRALKEGDTVELDELIFTVIDTPGHTKGGITYRCKDALFTGDTLFCENIGRTDLPGGSFDSIVTSIKKLYRLEGDYRVLPGHGSASTLEHERGHNPYVRVAR